jgi:Tfp pilus assembly PilM family ATPase
VSTSVPGPETAVVPPSGATGARRKPAGLGARLRRWLLEPEYPKVAIEIRPRAVGAVRLQRDRGRFVLGAAASLSLPDGAVSLSMAQPNVVDPAAVAETLRSVLERTGIPLSGSIALVLPDPVARVSVLPAGEFQDKDSDEIAELLRFKLRKSVPFEMKDARLSFVAPETAAPDSVLVAAAMARPVLESYEAVLSSLGLQPGLVELSGLALLAATEAALPPQDRLVVNWDDGYVSLLLSRGGRPVLVRTLIGEAATEQEDVVREVANTVLYYREKLGGAGLQSAFVRSTLIPGSAAVELLQEPLGMRPEIMNPWAGIEGGDVGPQAQAVAGAAACVSGKLA